MKGLVLKSLAIAASSEVEISSCGMGLSRGAPTFHAEGVTCDSRGNATGFHEHHESDRERVAQNVRLCDPFRVGFDFWNRSGGVAPGYYIGRFQRPKADPKSP